MVFSNEESILMFEEDDMIVWVLERTIKWVTWGKVLPKSIVGAKCFSQKKECHLS